MIIKTLSENTSLSESLGSEHGLSLHIETKRHRILFDTGASDLFAENAKKMGVDLSLVDLAVISHGHYDHGGGLKAFLKANSKARIYLRQQAFDPHYVKRDGGMKSYIGLDKTLAENERMVFCEDCFVVDQGLTLFSGVRGRTFLPTGNKILLVNQGDDFVLDQFAHEQNLIIEEDGKTLLLAGCAHAGIVNILNHFKEHKGSLPNIVIGGFHLYNWNEKGKEETAVVQHLGKSLLDTKAKFYTGHCTGLEPYNILKTVMGKNIEYISTGSVLDL